MKRSEISKKRRAAGAAILLAAAVTAGGIFASGAGSTAQAENGSSSAPAAEVYTLEPTSVSVYVSSNSVPSVTPDVLYVFEATQTYSEANSGDYANYIAEFVVTFDTSGADSADVNSWNGVAAVAGQYTGWNSSIDSNYIPMILGSTSSPITTGTEYYLLRDYLGIYGGNNWTGLTYAGDICGAVRTFNCGTLQTISGSENSSLYSAVSSLGGIDVPDGVEMTVELRLYESYTSSSETYSSNYVTIGSFTYTFGD